jgi:hypothetical protein
MQVKLRERRMEKRVLAKLLVADPYHGNTEQWRRTKKTDSFPRTAKLVKMELMKGSSEPSTSQNATAAPRIWRKTPTQSRAIIKTRRTLVNIAV